MYIKAGLGKDFGNDSFVGTAGLYINVDKKNIFGINTKINSEFGLAAPSNSKSTINVLFGRIDNIEDIHFVPYIGIGRSHVNIYSDEGVKIIDKFVWDLTGELHFLALTSKFVGLSLNTTGHWNKVRGFISIDLSINIGR